VQTKNAQEVVEAFRLLTTKVSVIEGKLTELKQTVAAPPAAALVR
jgi:phage-related minor tail protein